MSEADRATLAVEPGEVVFVLTQEHLDLPGDIVAQLSTFTHLADAQLDASNRNREFHLRGRDR